jgi:hypothetical protein
MKGEVTMSENKKLTSEEVAALLRKHAAENSDAIRALSDDELDTTAGGYGSYVISDSDGRRETGYCTHPQTTDASLKESLHSGTACAYGSAEGARTCDDCCYLICAISWEVQV